MCAGAALAGLFCFALLAWGESAPSAQRSFVGGDVCAGCHYVQHMSWAKSAHAKAFQALRAGERAAVKQRAGLDPGKDYTRDATCLACHTTGYGKAGGFVALDATPKTADVGCEACHGAGSDYVERVMRRKYAFAHAEIDELGHIGYTRRRHAHATPTAQGAADGGQAASGSGHSAAGGAGSAHGAPDSAHGTPGDDPATPGSGDGAPGGAHGAPERTGSQSGHAGHEQHSGHATTPERDKYGYDRLGDPPPWAHRHRGEILPLDPAKASHCMVCHNAQSPTHKVSGARDFAATFAEQVRKGTHRRYGLIFIHW